MGQRNYDLQERLINFSVTLISLVENLPNTMAAIHLGKQLLRSGTSPALNYGEAQGAESRNDFIHKMKICLKELRESQNGLKILYKARVYQSEKKISELITECGELIAIFVKCIETASGKK